jgi:hypothetical protein
VQQAPGLKFRIGMLALQAGNGHGVLPSLWIQSAAVLVAVATKTARASQLFSNRDVS